MSDICVIGKYMRDEVDDFNLPADYWQELTEATICGFKIVKNREAMDETEVVMIDAELRLPHDTDIDRRDRIKLTYRLVKEEGFILRKDQPVFRIIGQPIHGHAAIVVQLVRDMEV